MGPALARGPVTVDSKMHRGLLPGAPNFGTSSISGGIGAERALW